MKKKHVLRLLAAAVTMGMLAGTVSCGNAGQNDSQESSQAEKEKKEEQSFLGSTSVHRKLRVHH